MFGVGLRSDPKYNRVYGPGIEQNSPPTYGWVVLDSVSWFKIETESDIKPSLKLLELVP